MRHVLRRTGEICRHRDGNDVPVYTYDEWYRYDVYEGDTVIIDDGHTSSMYILKGDSKCDECPLRAEDSGLCALAVKCKITEMCRAVCRARFGVHPIDNLLEDL